MPPHFETVKSFADVRISDEGVETCSFLEASDGLVQMFDLLGSAVFGFIQNDLRGNIAGVRSRFEDTSDTSNTLEKLVRNESGECNKHGTPCLVRLVRGLTLTCKALQNLQQDQNAEVHACFQRSYDVVLRHHHGFIVRGVVAVAIRSAPRRHDFYARIAQGSPTEKLDAELSKWLEALDCIVQRLACFLKEGGYGQV